jgi:putative mRNA 3-end processing factor
VFSLAEKSLYVAALDIWIDSMRPRSRCYVSHGHSDHARGVHETIISTPHNAEVCRLRFGADKLRKARQTSMLPGKPKPALRFEEHDYNAPWTEGDHRLTLFSAGHVLGSAQLMIESDAGSFV